MKAEDYSSSFLVAFLVAFFAGFSSAFIEAFSSARAERSPRVVFSTFGISTCGSSGLAAFLAALAGASLRSSHVRARTEDTLSVTTSLNHLERQFVANIPRAIKKRKNTHPTTNKKMGSSFLMRSTFVQSIYIWFFRLIRSSVPFTTCILLVLYLYYFLLACINFVVMACIIFADFLYKLVLFSMACINLLPTWPLFTSLDPFLYKPPILSNKRFLVISTGTSSHFWSSTRLPMPHTTQQSTTTHTTPLLTHANSSKIKLKTHFLLHMCKKSSTFAPESVMRL